MTTRTNLLLGITLAVALLAGDLPSADAACDATSCSACYAQSTFTDSCGWCGELGGAGECKAGNTFGPASGSCDSGCWNVPQLGEKSCPSPCAGTTCAACLASGGGGGEGGFGPTCGWCESTQTCAYSDSFGKMCVKGHAAECPDYMKCLQTPNARDACPAVKCSDFSGKTCGECAQNAGCGWCGSTKTCIEGGDSFVGLCKDCDDGIKCYIGAASDKSCPAVQCESFATCGSCAANKGCGWCASEQKCLEGGDGFVGLCKDCDKEGTGCYKGSATDNCPTSVCSSLKDCHACGSMTGCGWDADKLSCVEVDTGNLESCEKDVTMGCLYLEAASCPATKTYLCSEYKDCRSCAAQDKACGWSSKLNACVEATTNGLGGCRGGTPFSYFDCEAHCDGLSDCGVCHDDPAGCTWCAGEFLNPILPRGERCVLADGAQAGPGDKKKPAYNHICSDTVATAKQCRACTDLTTCDACTANEKCGGCLSTAPPEGKHHFNCTRGDKHSSFEGCPTYDLRHPPVWAQKDIEPKETGSCSNEDRCHMATNCNDCQLLETQHGCVWCNDSVPLDTAAKSPCRFMAQCDAMHTTADNKCPPDVPCGGSNATCSECLKRHDCAWAGGGCMASDTAFSYTNFPYIWARVDQCPEVCGAHTDCEACGRAEGCGWCPTSGCLPGDLAGPDLHATGVQCSLWIFGAKQVSDGECEGSGLSTGAKIGLGVGVSAGAVVVGAGAFFWMRRKQSLKTETLLLQSPYGNPHYVPSCQGLRRCWTWFKRACSVYL